MTNAYQLALAVFAATALAFGPLDAMALDRSVKCESDKLKVAGKYAACRLGAESKAVKSGAAANFSKCSAQFSDKWQTIEARAGAGVCPSEGDESSIAARITADGGEVATLLAGGTIADDCGNGALDPGEQCDTANLGGATCDSLGYTLGGMLACDLQCHFDTTACASQQLPASGQTTSFGAGSDGDIEAGAVLAAVDNGDGTITDLNTGLTWEKKDDSGGIHDMDSGYTWCADTSPADLLCDNGTGQMDGTLVTDFLATLNAGGGFAGHTDWRIPNVRELQTIVDYENAGPAAGSPFHEPATCTGCADVTLADCSCTDASAYWSSSSVAGGLDEAWNVLFDNGGINARSKTSIRRARAVRGGL
jgi:hypothetical protein